MKIIYSITNILNGKVYIGKDSHGPNRRWNAHRRLLIRGIHTNQHLQNSWNKYGEKSFIQTILEQVTTASQLNKREQYFIKQYNSMDPSVGYNKTSGGEENSFSKESRLKLSKNNSRFWKNKKFSDEHKQKISASKLGCSSWNKGKPHTEKHKQNLSKNHADFAGIKHPFYGKHHSVEAAITISRKKRLVEYPMVINPIGISYNVEPTLLAFCRIHNLQTSCMSLLLRKKLKQHKGWRINA